MMPYDRVLAGIRREPIYVLGRLFLGIMFLIASIDKIRHPHMFGEIVYNYQILSGMGISLIAILLPWVELILGIVLIAGVWIPGAVLLANLLLLVFSGLLTYGVVRGLDVSCGCFSARPAADPAILWTALRDFVFLALAAYLLLRTFRQTR